MIFVSGERILNLLEFLSFCHFYTLKYQIKCHILVKTFAYFSTTLFTQCLGKYLQCIRNKKTNAFIYTKRDKIRNMEQSNQVVSFQERKRLSRRSLLYLLPLKKDFCLLNCRILSSKDSAHFFIEYFDANCLLTTHIDLVLYLQVLYLQVLYLQVLNLQYYTYRYYTYRSQTWKHGPLKYQKEMKGVPISPSGKLLC